MMRAYGNVSQCVDSLGLRCVLDVYRIQFDVLNIFYARLIRFSKAFRTFVPFTSSFKPTQSKLFHESTKSSTVANKSFRSSGN